MKVFSLPSIAIGVGSVVLAGSLAAQERTTLDATERPLTMSVERIYQLGLEAGPEWQLFTWIEPHDIGFDAAGNLLVLDDVRVLTVDPTGNLVRESGRRGQGPGEFEAPASIAVQPDGSFAVFDGGGSTLMWFDRVGALDHERRLDLSDLPDGPLRPHPRGGFVATAGQGLFASLASPDPEDSGIPLKRYAPTDRGGPGALFSAWKPVSAETEEPERGVVTVRLVEQTAFEPNLHFAVLPNGTLVVVDSVDYRLKVVNERGRVIATVERPLAPRPVSAGDRAREKDRLRDLAPTSGLSVGSSSGDTRAPRDGHLEELLEQLRFADSFPVIANLASDWDGLLWIERTGTPFGTPGPIDILSLEDGYLGTIPSGDVQFPAAFGPNGLVAFIVSDELDVRHITVGRVRLGL